VVERLPRHGHDDRGAEGPSGVGDGFVAWLTPVLQATGVAPDAVEVYVPCVMALLTMPEPAGVAADAALLAAAKHEALATLFGELDAARADPLAAAALARDVWSRWTAARPQSDEPDSLPQVPPPQIARPRHHCCSPGAAFEPGGARCSGSRGSWRCSCRGSSRWWWCVRLPVQLLAYCDGRLTS
jgi:hypothetical protein